MPKYSYAIGSDPEDMTNVEALESDRIAVPPRGLAVEPYSVYRTAASGTVYGDGYPQTKWVFDTVDQGFLDSLLSYISGASGQVYITTRDDDGDYTTYRAIMHRPRVHQEMSPAYGDNWHDVTIRFTRLEAV
jgi:hypothetical protein